MKSDLHVGKPLTGVHVVVTRPAVSAAALLRAVAAAGANPLRLPGLSLRRAADPKAALSQLRAARSADIWIVTSPAGVRYLWLLAPKLRIARRTHVFAVGQGTARALLRRGVAAMAPEIGQEGADGVLALPQLGMLKGRTIAVIGAPGGRDLAPALARRGARVLRVDVYRRQPAHLGPAQIAAVEAASAPLVTLLTSAEILRNLIAQLPPPAMRRLRKGHVIVASERLAKLALAAGFGRIAIAAAPSPRDLVASAISVLARQRSQA